MAIATRNIKSSGNKHTFVTTDVHAAHRLSNSRRVLEVEGMWAQHISKHKWPLSAHHLYDTFHLAQDPADATVTAIVFKDIQLHN